MKSTCFEKLKHIGVSCKDIVVVNKFPDQPESPPVDYLVGGPN